MVVVYVGRKRNKVNKYWFHDGYMIFIYCLVFFLVKIVNMKEEIIKNIYRMIVFTEILDFLNDWLWKSEKRNHRIDRKYYKNFLYVILLRKSWMLHIYSRNYMYVGVEISFRWYLKFEIKLEIWSTIRRI